ncbi:MAG TPA: ATP-grasp domain-containing protein [Sandaracinaceae bacterium LLY-WYZ-13_1]|nr:ATP-grasp domain-containing protein [Sandaracinaceae bacterium LLY-WYZ-13_1]
MTEAKNIFVVAPDEVHWEELQTVSGVGETIQVHPLLRPSDVVHVEDLRVKELLAKARAELDAFGGSVDGIIAQWDFPTTMLVPILCRERGLRSPTLDAVVRCGHKYWSRVAQRKAIPAHTPKFQLIDPFDETVGDRLELEYPFWMKPVKAFSSQLGFRIGSREDLEDAMAKTREEIERLAAPFDRILQEAEVGDEIRAIGGAYCIAEQYLSGLEVAHEGYVQDGEVVFHGTLDMIREEEVFTHFLWPSSKPDAVIERMEDATRELLTSIGFDDGCFNAEYFWDPDTNDLFIIEVNPRMSQSHAPLAMLVDGCSNHEIAIDIALARRPNFDPNRGRYAVAGKFLERVRQDGVVKRVPTEVELADLRSRFPSSTICVEVDEGQRLSELLDQDAYSYKYAEVYMGAENREKLLEQHQALLESIPFEIEPVTSANP